MEESSHQAYILLGSNISPVENLRKAVGLLCSLGAVKRISGVWETLAVGSDGPNFLNAALLLQTALTKVELKRQMLAPVENTLGRLRTEDKNAPRTIDLDIIIYDDIILDPNIWTRTHIALPMLEIAPNLTHPDSKKGLDEIASALIQGGWATIHPEIRLVNYC